MRASSINLSSFGVLLLLTVSSEATRVRRFNYDAILLETANPESRYVQFSRTLPTQWANLTSLVTQHKLSTHQVICTRGEGSWLGYPSNNYLLGTGISYTLILGESCMNAEEYNSFQPIGDIKYPFQSGLVVFPKEHFQSNGVVLSTGSYTGELKSLIFAGGSPWSITSEFKTVCLMPSHRRSVAYDLCLVPTLDSSFGFSPTGLKTVSQGCNGNNVRLVTVQNCYAKGVFRIVPSNDFSLTKIKPLCGGQPDIPWQSKFGQIMEIWKGRISSGIEDMNNIKIPHESIYQMKLLWSLVDIFKSRCSNVDPNYVSILRNVFLLHLRKAWNKTPSLIKPEDEYWRHTSMFLNACHENGHKHPPTDNPTRCTPDKGPPTGRRDWQAFLELSTGTEYDLVIEQIWMVMNTVVPYCNSINGYRTNDWTNIVSLLRNHFLEPVGHQWLNPGDWQKLYVSMFNGYNVKRMRGQILKCAQDTLKATAQFNPIGRPKYILHEEQSIAAEIFLPGQGGGRPHHEGSMGQDGDLGDKLTGKSRTKDNGQGSGKGGKGGKVKGVPKGKKQREAQFFEYVENNLGEEVEEIGIEGEEANLEEDPETDPAAEVEDYEEIEKAIVMSTPSSYRPNSKPEVPIRSKVWKSTKGKTFGGLG